jgi:hypothetical protein
MKICSGNTNNPSDDTIALSTCHVDKEDVGQLARVEAAEAVLHVQEGGPASSSQVENIAEVQGPVGFLLHPISVAILIFINVMRIHKLRRPCRTLYRMPASLCPVWMDWELGYNYLCRRPF